MNKPGSNVNEGVVWKDPYKDSGVFSEMKTNEESYKAAEDLANLIAQQLFPYGLAKDLTAKLLTNAIKDQMHQYFKEYENVVAESILKHYFKHSLSKTNIEPDFIKVDYDYSRHAKFSTLNKMLEQFIHEATNPEILDNKILKLLRVTVNDENDTPIEYVQLNEVLDVVQKHCQSLKKQKVDFKKVGEETRINKMKKGDQIIIKRDDKLIPIQELPKKEYEEFLDFILQLRTLYIATKRDREKK